MIYSDMVDEFPPEMREPRFIHIIRSPMEVAASLKRRNDFPYEKSLTLWAEHVLEAEEHSTGYPRIFINYQQLLDDWSDTFTNMANVLYLEWPVALTDASGRLDKFLAKQLRHFHKDFIEDPVIDNVPDFVAATYQRPTEACGQRHIGQEGFLDECRKALKSHIYSWPMFAVSADLRSLVADRDNSLGKLSGVIQERDSQIAQLQEGVRTDDEELDRLKEQFENTKVMLIHATDENQLRVSAIESAQRQIQEAEAALDGYKKQLQRRNEMIDAHDSRIRDMESQIVELQGRIQELHEERSTLVEQLESSRRSFADAKERLTEKEIELSGIYQSTSWRLTAPVRFLGRAVPRSQ